MGNGLGHGTTLVNLVLARYIRVGPIVQQRLAEEKKQ